MRWATKPRYQARAAGRAESGRVRCLNLQRCRTKRGDVLVGVTACDTLRRALPRECDVLSFVAFPNPSAGIGQPDYVMYVEPRGAGRRDGFDDEPSHPEADQRVIGATALMNVYRRPSSRGQLLVGIMPARHLRRALDDIEPQCNLAKFVLVPCAHTVMANDPDLVMYAEPRFTRG